MLKRMIGRACLVLTASAVASPLPTMAAELTGNAGVMSEYLFRGLGQSDGASVYGGLDYNHDTGFYAGTWAATINFGGSPTGETGAFNSVGTELDLYGGYAGSTESFSYNVGAIYYVYTEEDENDDPDTSYDTPEVYGSLGFGPVSIDAYWAPDTYFGVDDSAYGVGVAGSIPISELFSVDGGIGYNGGDGNAGFLPAGDDEYMLYTLGVSANLDNGFAFSFGLVDTDIDNDEAKVVIDASYSFDLL